MGEMSSVSSLGLFVKSFLSELTCSSCCDLAAGLSAAATSDLERFSLTLVKGEEESEVDVFGVLDGRTESVSARLDMEVGSVLREESSFTSSTSSSLSARLLFFRIYSFDVLSLDPDCFDKYT